MRKLLQNRDDDSYWPYLLLAAAVGLVAMLATRVPLWQVPLIVGAGWFVLDMVARAYLIKSPMETYKDPDGKPGTYKMEKEQEAEEILKRYRIGRWLLSAREK